MENKYFAFTEEQKKRIRSIVNKYFIEEDCDTWGHYMGCSGGTAFGPPCRNCNRGKNYLPDDYVRENNNRMLEEIEKIINEQMIGN